MTEKQVTIKEAVSLSGTGIHTGETTTITFKPAPENYGIRFVRTDLPKEIEIPALVDHVIDLSRGTTIGIANAKVLTVEHVLAALSGMQIDNCRIELNGSEPPVVDGSSLPYVQTLQKAGLEEQKADREYFEIEETIRYTNETKGVDIVALPNDEFRITVMVDYFNPALGSQHTGLFNLEKEFISEFAPARTFCFLTEVEELFEQGLIKGGTLDNALVIIDKEIDNTEVAHLKKLLNLSGPIEVSDSGLLNNTKLRFKNEPARHKLLDMIGDLTLAGVSIRGQILAARPGHASNFEFAKRIREAYKKTKPTKRIKNIESKPTLFDIYDLLKVMPHRYPILLIDKIVDLDTPNNTIIGIKNVTFNEPYFMGHFPEKPVMPGVLICEAMAQTGCLMLMQTINLENKLALFMGINKAKFRKPVIPGDQLVMELTLIGKRFNTYTFHGKSYVKGELVAEAELSAAIVDKDIKL
jgi:UDP-3-O-[3-hydroxymyristoyl] N-acetylglucosamine deacetylase/3-hydroxyacyl-[acyl-carrier-protein] dehydratase